jgi:hypothetical protein
LRQARLVPVRLGKASRGTLWLGRYGKVRFGKAWSDRVGQAWSGLASSGEFGRGAAVEVWCGMVRLGLARQARRGRLRHGLVRYGVLRQVRCGMVWLGEVWLGKAGAARCVWARCVKARQGRLGSLIIIRRSNMVYEWKGASRIKADAQKAGELFEQLEAENDLTAARVVEESRAEDAVLHNEFEWNDSEAASKYREGQARHLINAITIATVKAEGCDKPIPVRAFFNVSADSTYTSVVSIANSAEKTANLVAQAKRELITFSNKYNAIQSYLSGVFDAIKEVTDVKSDS